MQRISGKQEVRLFLIGSVVASNILIGSCQHSLAQIVPDNTLGTESSQVIENFQGLPVDIITGGAQREQNLFHSFQEFNINEGRAASFISPANVQNIFSRVTGSNTSEILGVLSVLGESNPNLYLINPNGIVFGSDARLLIQGSFTATTADAITFGEGGLFSAINPQDSILTISVPLGLQLGSNPGSILNQSFVEDETGELVGLQVPTEKDLTLVGGEIVFDRGQATASGGNIYIGGLSEAGTVEISDDGSLVFPEFVARADVLLTNAADIDVRGTGGGNIEINTRNLTMESGEFGRSQIRAGIIANSTFSEAPAGNIALNADNNITVKNSFVFNDVEESAVGNSGDINFIGKSVEIIDGSLIMAGTDGQGNSGRINIIADDEVIIDDRNGNTFVANNVFSDGVGSSGGINITANSLFVRNGAQIQSLTEGIGDSGMISINAKDTASFDGRDVNDFASSARSGVEEDARGNAGGIEVIASSLSLTNRAQFSSSTQGVGNAGDIILKVDGDIKLDGSQILSEVGAPNEFGIEGNGGFGTAGDVIIEANSLLMENGSSINSDTENVGNAGNINIDVTEGVILEGEGLGSFSGSTDIFPSQISSTAEEDSMGDAGNISISASKLQVDDGFIRSANFSIGDAGEIRIETGSLRLLNGAIVDASTFGQGNSGGIDITATDSIFVDRGSSDDSDSRITSFVGFVGNGNSGGIRISTDSLSLMNGARIDASAAGKGNSGTIEILATGSITVEGNSSNELPTGIVSQVTAEAEGNSGGIKIISESLNIFDNGRIVASTFGQGFAGAVEINSNNITVSNQSSISSQSESNFDAADVTFNIADSIQLTDSEISTSSIQSSGGNITINAPNANIQLRGDSDISTNISSGTGSGGNIEITANSIIAFDDSDIFAFAAGGAGGDITLDTESFFAENFTANSLTQKNTALLDNNNRADINATGGVSGVVDIPDVSFLQNALTELDNNAINTEQLVANSCVVPNREQEGTFLITGRGGLATTPDDDSVSGFSTGDVQTIADRDTSYQWQPGDRIIEPQGVYRLSDGRLVMSRECRNSY